MPRKSSSSKSATKQSSNSKPKQADQRHASLSRTPSTNGNINDNRRNLTLVERSDPRCPSYSKEDYPYIERGFILPSTNLLHNLETFSCFHANNETANVISQFLGLALFVWMMWTVKSVPTKDLIDHSEFPKSSDIDAEARRFYYEVALASCIICCCSSLICHLYQSRSRGWHDFLSVCDWSGTILISASSCYALDSVDLEPLIRHHVTASQWLADTLVWSTGPEHLKLSLALLAVTLAILVFALTSHAVRFLLIFVAIVAITLPSIVLCFLIRPKTSINGLIAVMCGGFHFGSHYPERWKPRMFDIILPSHTLWHIGYLLCLASTFDTFAVIFFGRSPYHAL